MKEQTGRTDTITLNNRCITCTNTTVYEAVQEVEQTILFVRLRQEQSTKKLMSGRVSTTEYQPLQNSDPELKLLSSLDFLNARRLLHSTGLETSSFRYCFPGSSHQVDYFWIKWRNYN